MVDEDDKNSVVINNTKGEFLHANLANRTFGSTDTDCDTFSLASGPVIEVRESEEQTSNQPVYVRQCQPLTPEPIEILLKSRPIIAEQWLSNKPPAKRLTYHHQSFQNEAKRPYNRYIEYKKPRIRIEIEIIRLPIIKLDPRNYSTTSNLIWRI